MGVEYGGGLWHKLRKRNARTYRAFASPATSIAARHVKKPAAAKLKLRVSVAIRVVMLG
jgi:hypothetical protein